MPSINNKSLVQEINLNINDYDLAFKKAGSGFPLVLLHTWRPYAKYFLNSLPKDVNYQTLTVDIPGYYSKKQKKAVTTVEGFSQLLEALFQNLGFQKVDLLGQCLGGVLALHFAASYPHRVRKIIVATPPFLCYKQPLNRILRISLSLLEKSALLGSLATFFIRRRVYKGVTGFLGGYKSFLEILSLESDRVSQSDFDHKVVFGILKSAFSLNLEDLVKRVKAEVLFITGENDPLIKGNKLEEITRIMENARYEIIPKAKHAVIIKNTEEFNSAVTNFLL